MNQLKGTWKLVLLALRRDRVKMTIAVVAVGFLVPMFFAGISEVFESEEEMKQGIAFLSANPAMRLFGLPTGDELGNLFMLRAFTGLALIVAFVNTFAIVRHTRQNEELGRFELVGSAAVGRYAGLVAALIVITFANIVLSILAYIGMLASDISSTDAVLVALALGCVGMAFSGVAAVCAQLTQTSRGANGLAAACVGISFFLSGIGSLLGDLAPSGVEVEAAWPMWISPIGWGQQLQPFAQEQWWVLWIVAIFWFVSVGASLLLLSRRDVGMGIFDTLPGRASATRGLLSIAGLTLRLHRGVFTGWLICLLLLGGVYGLVSGDVEDLLSQAEGIAEVLIAATGMDEIMLAYFGAIMGVLGMFALAYTIQVMLRIRSEEVRALDFLLSMRVSRSYWLFVQAAFAIVTTCIILVAAAISAGIVSGYVMEDSGEMILPLVAGALVHMPVIFLFTGLVVALFGLIPRMAVGLSWTFFVVSIVLGPFIGSMLNVPEALLDVSPLTHVPTVPPTEDIEVLPLVVLASIGAVLLAVGFIAFRRRNLVEV